MKEALLFNECFVESVVESEAASLSSQPEQFDHAGTQIELCQLQHSSGWPHFGTRMFAVAKFCESVDKV